MEAVPRYTVDGIVHPPTLVCATARMAGYFLLRSTGAVTDEMKPGAAVLSPQVSERSGILLRTCAAVLATLGHVIPSDPPRPLVPEGTRPREDVLETQARLLPVFDPFRRSYALDDYELSRAAAVATAMTVHTLRKHLDVMTAFGIAAFGFAEGSHTVPMPTADSADSV